MQRRLITLFLLLLSFSMLHSQEADTTLISDTIPKHSPAKATLLSAVVPGLGQAYNKKYWKIPLVYAAIGASLYFAIDQRNKFEDFKSAYAKRVDNDPLTVDTKYKLYSNNDLLNSIDFHRKNRDLLFVLTGVAYALQIVDAAVDAHLYYFDVSDNLSASIRPNVQYNMPQQLMVPSLTFSLKFAKKPRRSAF
jgi:hypothetical protein